MSFRFRESERRTIMKGIATTLAIITAHFKYFITTFISLLCEENYFFLQDNRVT